MERRRGKSKSFRVSLTTKRRQERGILIKENWEKVVREYNVANIFGDDEESKGKGEDKVCNIYPGDKGEIASKTERRKVQKYTHNLLG